MEARNHKTCFVIELMRSRYFKLFVGTGQIARVSLK